MSLGSLKHPHVKRMKPGSNRWFKINVLVHRADGISTGLTQKLHARAKRHGKDFAKHEHLLQALKGRAYCAVAHVNRNYRVNEPRGKKRAGGVKWSETSCARTPTKAVKAALKSMMRAMR